MNITSRFGRLAATLLLATLAAGGPGQAAWAQEEESPPQPPTTAPVPDDRGVVHSWALAPGDGTLESGERPNLSYELPPGGEVQDVVTLFNYSNVSLTFNVYATDAFNNADGAFELLPFDEQPSGVGTWFDLARDAAITIPAGTQATFPVTIRVPADARPGDHAGALLAASAAMGTGPEGDTVTLDRRTGTRVYVRVTGPLQPEIAVEELSSTYTPDLDPRSGSTKIRYRVVNRGNVRLAATHRASVSGPFGLLRRSTEPEEIVELLPGESVEFTRTIDGVPATGISFTEVDVQPRSVSGEELDLDGADRRSFGFAIPLTVVAVLLAALLGWYARRAYLRHRDLENPTGDDQLAHTLT